MIDKNTLLLENLLDAGCSECFAQQFISLYSSSKGQEAVRLLSTHRKTLLDTVHEYQKKIDCLDFLIYKIEKNEM